MELPFEKCVIHGTRRKEKWGSKSQIYGLWITKRMAKQDESFLKKNLGLSKFWKVKESENSFCAYSEDGALNSFRLCTISGPMLLTQRFQNCQNWNSNMTSGFAWAGFKPSPSGLGKWEISQFYNNRWMCKCSFKNK